MLTRILYVTAFYFILSGCRSEVETKALTRAIDSLYAEEIKAFDFHFDDSVSFVFSSNRAFDTSFIVILNKVDTTIKGKYLYYPPSYYPNFGDWENLNVFLYKGINFTIAQKKWQVIASQIGYLQDSLAQRTTDINNVIHPPNFKLSFNGLNISNRHYENHYFESVYNIINDSLLKEILSHYPTVNGHIP